MAVSPRKVKVKCTHGFHGLLDCPHCIGEWADLMEWQREMDEAAEVARLAACWGDEEETVVDWGLVFEGVG